MNCPLCGAELEAFGTHLTRVHDAPPRRDAVSDLRVGVALGLADEVVARDAARTAVAGEVVEGLSFDDRIVAGAWCLRWGHRSAALQRLGLSGRMISMLAAMHDSGRLDELDAEVTPRLLSTP